MNGDVIPPLTLTSHCMQVIDQIYVPTDLSTETVTITHWMGSRVEYDSVKKRNLSLPGTEPLPPGHYIEGVISVLRMWICNICFVRYGVDRAGSLRINFFWHIKAVSLVEWSPGVQVSGSSSQKHLLFILFVAQRWR